MKRKWLAIGIILLFVGTCIIPAIAQNSEKSQSTSKGNWLYVGGNGPYNYTKIQDAINDSVDGDTVFVYNGTYQENSITINKSIWLLGENKSTTIIDGVHSQESINILVTSSNVIVCEFTLMNCLSGGFGQGFYLYGNPHLENICISDCIIKNNDKGIYFINISHLIISSCYIHHNQGPSIWGENSSEININNCEVHNNGIDLGGGWSRSGGFFFHTIENRTYSNVNIFNCNIYDNLCDGILFDTKNSNNITIYNNNIYRNTGTGIYSCGIKNLIIHNNSIHDHENFPGLLLETSENVNIFDNQITMNLLEVNDDYYLTSPGAIRMTSVLSLLLCNNTISFNNGWGIAMGECNHGFISRNNFIKNEYGLFLFNCSNNTISDNLIQESEYGLLLYVGDYFNIISGNLISKNINGTFIESSGKCTITENSFIENENALYLYDVKSPKIEYICGHKIEFNNFINNKKDASFWVEPERLTGLLKISNKWNNNYWDRSRFISKPIFGAVKIIYLPLPAFPWIQFDWHPASEPYNIPGMR